MKSKRKIIHIDMDAFFASVEQLDNPELKGKPVIVGGAPASRGVVAACSYEARVFGIRSAMPCARAVKLCPQACFIEPRLSRYREVSQQIMAIFTQYTDIIEPLSLDEAFLDITVNKKNRASATLLAQDICQQIFRETGLTASAGVSCNKFVAKIASDLNKPNGITVITPAEVLDFLAALPIGKFYGVGRVTEKKMTAVGIRTGADLRACSCDYLVEHFGKTGRFYFDIVRGIDPRPVQTSRVRKSVGAERTFREDSRDPALLGAVLAGLADRVGGSLKKRKTVARTITLKVRYSDFSATTRSLTVAEPVSSAADILRCARRLITRTDAGSRKVRLLGISVAGLQPADLRAPRQLSLPFPAPLLTPLEGTRSSRP